MTVRDLMTELAKHDPDALVVMFKDGEGNNVSPLYEATAGHYVPDTAWTGDIVFLTLTDELRELGYAEKDAYDGEDAQPAVCLWPVN